MNMKKLINDTKFDNVEQLSKRWNKKTVISLPSNDIQNKQIQSNIELNQQCSKNQNIDHNFGILPQNSLNFPTTNNNNQTRQTITTQMKSSNSKQNNNLNQINTNYSIPKVMDQDTQHFKNRLELLLNTFKIDTIGQFMNMKRNMLEYQQENVKKDTHKYLTAYEQKHQQLLHVKEKLINMSELTQKKTIQCQLMCTHIAKLNERVRIMKYLSRPFSLLYQNKQRSKMSKFKQKQAKKFNDKRLKCKSIYGWRNYYRKRLQERTSQQQKIYIQKQVNNIVGRFQKDMEMLKEQLADSLKTNEEYENNKHLMQENLKKAFLRGVCAMNMEAIGVFGNQQNSEKVNQNIGKELGPDFSQTQTISNIQITNNNRTMFNFKQQNQSQNSSVLLINKPKPQSKDHKWQQAPILGIQQKKRNGQQQLRPRVVRPETEGKVIKVVDGRSKLQIKKNDIKSSNKRNS